MEFKEIAGICDIPHKLFNVSLREFNQFIMVCPSLIILDKGRAIVSGPLNGLFYDEVKLFLILFPVDAPHRLNLFYLANDVIQNCKRKNAIVYRTTFTDVLPEAMKLIRWVCFHQWT